MSNIKTPKFVEPAQADNIAAIKKALVGVKPASDYLLVIPKSSAKKSEGGIVLPDSAVEVSFEATVLAVGPGRPCRRWGSGRASECL